MREMFTPVEIRANYAFERMEIEVQVLYRNDHGVHVMEPITFDSMRRVDPGDSIQPTLMLSEETARKLVEAISAVLP